MMDALALHRFLLTTSSQHEIVRLPRALRSAGDLPAVLGLPADRCLVVGVYESDQEPFAVVTRAGATIATAILAAATGAKKISRASATRVNQLTDFAAELVAPILLPPGLRLLVDERIVARVDADEIVYTATGEPRTALGIHKLDLIALWDAKPIDVTGSRNRRIRERIRAQ